MGEEEEGPQPAAGSLEVAPSVQAPAPPPPPRPPKKPTPIYKIKKPPTKKQQVLIQQKLDRLSQNLRPFPISPPPNYLQTLAPYEPLLRSLGLWDFASLPLDSSPLRPDLLSDLIAHYDPAKHHSLVRGLRLRLSRADLARALSLPIPKNLKSNCDFDSKPFGGADEVAAVLFKFMSNMMVFLDDAAILPDEAVTANRLVREGQPNRVDWAGLMWALVEREIREAPEKGNCYYASHLQRLMKCQKPQLFQEEAPKPELETEEAAVTTIEDDVDAEELGDVGSEKCGPGLSLGVARDRKESEKGEDEEQVVACLPECGLDDATGGSGHGSLSKEELGKGGRAEGNKCCLLDSSKQDPDKEQRRELNKEEPDKEQCKGLSSEEPHQNDLCEELSKEEPDTELQKDWNKEVPDVKQLKHSNAEEALKDECNLMSEEEPGKAQPEDLNEEVPGKRVSEDVSKEEPEKGAMVEGDQLMGKGEVDKGKGVDVMSDDELAGERQPTLERLTSPDFMHVMATNSNVQFCLDQSDGDFLSMSSDMQNKSMGLEMGPGSSSLFGNEHKRMIDNVSDRGHQQKRLRGDQPWEHTPTVAGFDGCMEQLHCLMGKARMDLIEKEQAFVNVQVQLQYLNGMLQQKDAIIQALEKTRMEEMQKREAVASRLDHDVKTLSGIVFGCRKSLKETQTAFAEYRKKFPVDNESLSGEDEGTCGDVLGVKGFRKPRSTVEEKILLTADKMLKDFNQIWSDKFDKHNTLVSVSATKLVRLQGEIELLKERLAEKRSNDKLDHDQN